MKNILITGASRGLGLEITKQELERNNFVLIKTLDVIYSNAGILNKNHKVNLKMFYLIGAYAKL